AHLVREADQHASGKKPPATPLLGADRRLCEGSFGAHNGAVLGSRLQNEHSSSGVVLGSFRLGFRGLRSSWHLRLLEADQQPGLRLVRAKVHEATGNILSQILQACFDDCVVGSDFPSDPLSLFVYLAGDRRLLTAQYVLVSTAYHTILINRKLEKHV